MSEDVTLEECALFMESTINDLWELLTAIEDVIEPADPIKRGFLLGRLTSTIRERIEFCEEFYEKDLKKHRCG